MYYNGYKILQDLGELEDPKIITYFNSQHYHTVLTVELGEGDIEM